MGCIMSIKVCMYRFIWCLHWATVADKPYIGIFFCLFAHFSLVP